MSNAAHDMPGARREGLNTQAVGGELLVFDHSSDRAHALNGPAAFVWQHADGTRSADEIAQAMTNKFGAEADAHVVWYALEQLKRRDLMETGGNAPAKWRGMTRRQFLGRVAAGAVLLAVVTSIATPSPAHAQSACLGIGANCFTAPTTCCPGLGCCAASDYVCDPTCP